MKQIELRDINATAAVALNASVFAESIHLGDRVKIGSGSVIRVKNLTLGDDVEIGDGVTIDTDRLTLGSGTRMGHRSQISGMKGRGEYAVLGERTLIANDTRILVPRIVIGDYSAIHNNGLLNGKDTMVLGHNVWVGQNAILNSEDKLLIGNNVGIGAYSSVYTHGYFGDLLEGCQVFKVAPVTIEDDVWILGSYNIISPGVVLGRKALILSGSNVTKSVPPYHTVGGAPAKDLTDRLIPYKDRSVADKLDQMKIYVSEFLQERYAEKFSSTHDEYLVHAQPGPFKIKFVPGEVGSEFEEVMPTIVIAEKFSKTKTPANITEICLTSRQYSKARTPCEIEFLHYLKSYKARFVPRDHPIVSAL